ncbi:hypothetical protein EV361DRAFT_955085 [Lentinula raphanica]|nr:hypothetical protein EV361DRAFT_955085 [Lentinula raphanica]
MSKSPADIPAHLAVDHDFLFATKTSCDVEVDFGDKFAVAHFKPLHAEDNPYRDPKIIIPLNDRDRELFKKCDDLVSGRSGSTTLDHDPHSHNSPIIPTHSSSPQGPDDLSPYDDHSSPYTPPSHNAHPQDWHNFLPYRDPPSTRPSHNNPPARRAYPNQSPPPPYEP